MNYQDAITNKIDGNTGEKEQREELWKAIINAYEQGGEDAIKSCLIEKVNPIINKFDTLLEQLRKKL